MFNSKWPTYSNKMIKHVTEILKSGKINQWNGTKVFEFEKEFTKKLKHKYGVSVMNGSIALELALHSINIHPNDEVIVSPRSFIASASCVSVLGATPIFGDVDLESQSLTLDSIKKLTNKNTKAIILVNLGGCPAYETIDIFNFCKTNNIYLIQDNAQCFGKINNTYVSHWSDISCFSFCTDKIISTGGEGGFVVTDNQSIFTKLLSFKDHGKNPSKMFSDIDTRTKLSPSSHLFNFVHDSIGNNYRMTEIQASLGLDSLKCLDNWISIRRRNADILYSYLTFCLSIRLIVPPPNIYHSYYKFYCFVKNPAIRNNLLEKINNEGIPCFQGTGDITRESAYNLNITLPNNKLLFESSLVFNVDPSYSENTMNIIGKKLRTIIN